MLFLFYCSAKMTLEFLLPNSFTVIVGKYAETSLSYQSHINILCDVINLYFTLKNISSLYFWVSTCTCHSWMNVSAENIIRYKYINIHLLEYKEKRWWWWYLYEDDIFINKTEFIALHSRVCTAHKSFHIELCTWHAWHSILGWFLV